MADLKDVMIEPTGNDDEVSQLIEGASKEGIKQFLFYSDSKDFRNNDLVSISPSDDSDVKLVSSLGALINIKSTGKKTAFDISISNNDDVNEALQASKLGANMLIVDTDDWTIIPLENLIAEMKNSETKLYVKIKKGSDARTMFHVLDKGVDGVVLTTSSLEEVKIANDELISILPIPLQEVEVITVKEVGSGDRVCIDGTSILNNGEGILVGSSSSFLFLMHNESTGSEFTSPRPFRVNAGAVHSYTLLPDGRTKYLSELEGGDDTLIVSKEGKSRTTVAGRIKIENRPLTLVKAKINDLIGGILVQNAETIAFVSNEKIIPVTELKPGDIILARVEQASARHFGTKVDEFILEK